MRRTVSIAGLSIILFFSTAAAQDTDVKEIYSTVTTEINSLLLTRQGAVELSGFLFYNYYRTEFESEDIQKQHILQLEPAASYFIIDNLSFGLQVSYLYQQTINETEDISRTVDQIFIGPFTKFYFNERTIRPFVLLDYLFLIGDEYDGQAFDVGAGILYHLTGNIGLNLQIKYGFLSSGKTEIDHQNRIFIGVGLSGFLL